MTFEEYSFDSVNTINRINTKTQTSCSFIPILINKSWNGLKEQVVREKRATHLNISGAPLKYE